MIEVDKVYLGDNLQILQDIPDESIDLICTDPPYNLRREVKKGHLQWHNRPKKHLYYDDTSRYKRSENTWIDTCDEWHDRNKDSEFYFIHHFCTPSELYYFEDMIKVLVELKRVLKRKGMFYWQCDWRTNYIFRIILNHIFKDRACFKNEIIWYYSNKISLYSLKKRYNNNYDSILFYSGDQRNSENINLECEQGTKNLMGSVWKIPFIQGKECVGYPTQKPLELYYRMIKTSSEVGDIVLDPFCGSGTVLVSAKELGRKYIGIDKKPEAIRISKERLSTPNLFYRK